MSKYINMSALKDLDPSYNDLLYSVIDSKGKRELKETSELKDRSDKSRHYNLDEVKRWMNHVSVDPRTGKRIYRGSANDVELRRYAQELGYDVPQSCINVKGGLIRWIQSNRSTAGALRMCEEILCRNCGEGARLYFVHDYLGNEKCPLCGYGINCKYICTRVDCLSSLIRNGTT